MLDFIYLFSSLLIYLLLFVYVCLFIFIKLHVIGDLIFLLLLLLLLVVVVVVVVLNLHELILRFFLIYACIDIFLFSFFKLACFFYSLLLLLLLFSYYNVSNLYILFIYLFCMRI